MYMDKIGQISTFLVRNLIVILQWGVGGKGGEGEVDIKKEARQSQWLASERSNMWGERVEKGKWTYVHIHVTTCLNEIKKGGETSKSKILQI